MGTSGGLAILWNPEEVLFSNWISLSRILSGLFSVTRSGMDSHHKSLWTAHTKGTKKLSKGLANHKKDLSRNIIDSRGEFNMIHTIEEKRGGINRPDHANN